MFLLSFYQLCGSFIKLFTGYNNKNAIELFPEMGSHVLNLFIISIWKYLMTFFRSGKFSMSLEWNPENKREMFFYFFS